jgi:acyl carrier protein
MDKLITLDALSTLDSAEAGSAIRQSLASLLRQVLRSNGDGPLAVGNDPRDVRLSSLGVDSLMATELRNRVRAWANVDLPAHLLIGNSTVEEVADLIYQKVLLGYLSPALQNADALADDGEEFVL